MATTAIWDVRGWLGKVVIYAENPDKTENPSYYQKQDMTDKEAQGLSDVIEYAVRDEKVRAKADIGDDASAMQYFVTGVNCFPSTARDEMMAVKKRYGKDDGIVAFHGYQSFAPGEATPDTAHQIGMELARQLWGDRFQVLVATHLDTQSPETFKGGGIWDVIVDIHGALQAIGYALLVLFFVVGVIKTCGSFVEVKAHYRT